ncbi:MAG: hypothetical protein U0U67_16725 [Chitinophagales bacterium]
MNHSIFLSLLMFLLVISCKHKQEPKQSVILDPNTSIYINDSIKYFELLKLKDYTLLDVYNSNDELPKPIIECLSKYFEVKNSDLGNPFTTRCSCINPRKGIKKIYIHSSHKIGILFCCEGSDLPINSCFYYNIFDSLNPMFFKIIFKNSERELSVFDQSIKTNNIIVDKGCFI